MLLPGETGNSEIVQNTKKYHLVTAEAPFTVKMIDCMHHSGPRKEQHPAVCYPHG